MLRTRTYKYRLYPTENQARELGHTLEVCRILYNSCIVDRRNHYERTGKGLSRIDQQRILVADKKRIPLLTRVHSQVLQGVLFRAERAFQAFFRRVAEKNGKAGYPRFKSEGRYDSIAYPQEPGFALRDGKLALSKIGHIKMKMHRQIEGKLKTCTVVRDGDHWYACFSVEREAVPCGPIPDKAIGIDVGIKNFVVLSDGTSVENPKCLVRSEAKLAHLQRSLSRKKKGSSNRKKAKLLVARLHRKVRNQRSDFQHKLSREIIDTYGVIAVEDLRIRNMVRNRHLARSISDASWGMFFNLLAYKAEEAGRKLVKVTPNGTSQVCSRCGEKVPKSLSVRIHKCPFCGLVLNRDVNAAINRLRKSTVGATGSYARGEVALLGPSLNREASSVRAG